MWHCQKQGAQSRGPASKLCWVEPRGCGVHEGHNSLPCCVGSWSGEYTKGSGPGSEGEERPVGRVPVEEEKVGLVL